LELVDQLLCLPGKLSAFADQFVGLANDLAQFTIHGRNYALRGDALPLKKSEAAMAQLGVSHAKPFGHTFRLHHPVELCAMASEKFCSMAPQPRYHPQPSSLPAAIQLHPKRTNYETPFQNP